MESINYYEAAICNNRIIGLSISFAVFAQIVCFQIPPQKNTHMYQ